jgi:hypothetical protein
LSAEIISQGKQVVLEPGKSVYRIGEGFAARTYIISGIPTTHNKDNWTQLGPGFYTGTRNTALGYAGTVKGLPVLMEFAIDRKAYGLQVYDSALLDNVELDKIAKLAKTYDFIFMDEGKIGVQWKFHSQFYKDGLKLVWLSSKEHDGSYKPHTPSDYVTEFEKYIIGKHKNDADEWKREQEKKRKERQAESANTDPVAANLLKAPDAED